MKSSLKKNLLLQFCYEALLFVIPLITSPYISRVLGAEQLGIYAYSYSVAYYFQLVAMLGLKYHGTRAIAAVKDNRHERNKTFSSIFVLHAVLSCFVTIVYLLYCLNVKGQYRTIAIIQSLNVVSSFFDINWLFFGIEKFKITVSRNALIKIATLVLIFTFVREKEDLWKYTLIMSLGMTLSQAVVWVFVFKYVHFVKVSFSEVLAHVKPMLVLFVPIISVSVLKYMDKIMLGVMSTDQQVGFYDNVHKIIEMPSSLIVAVGTVMLPRITNLTIKGDADKARYYTKCSYLYLMCLEIGVAFGLIAVSDSFAVVFWGNEFAPCGVIIKLLAISIPFTAYSNITRTHILMPNHLDNVYIRSTSIGMLVNIVLNMLLIQKYSAIGVSIATIVSEFVIMIYQIFSTRHLLNQFNVIKSCIIFIVPGSVMLVVLHMLFGNTTSVLVLFMEVFIGFIVYSLLCFCILCKTM